MFGRRFFGGRYFAPRYFGDGGAASTGAEDLAIFIRRRRYG